MGASPPFTLEAQMRSLRVGHLKVPIIHDDTIEDAGQYSDSRGHRITINTYICPEGSAEYYNTLFHEALHAILNITGLSEHITDEELVVRAFEIHLANLFRDNTDFQRDYMNANSS